ncbi:MAG: hypothetical protein JJE04_11995 [Acidobacteriia bacterium]|nr:hypothetical protein [Terriglobia bacterium]
MTADAENSRLGRAAKVIIALLWAAFAFAWVRVIRTQPSELINGLLWIGAMAVAYGAGLALWIWYCLCTAQKPKVRCFARSVFTVDHFGRPIEVAPHAALGAKHLVVQIRNGRKIYSLPELPGEEHTAVEVEVFTR